MAFTAITYNVETKKISFSYTPDGNIGGGTTINTNFRLTDPVTNVYYGAGKTTANWLNVTAPPTFDYTQAYAGPLASYVDFFDIPVDLGGSIISGIYTLTYNQNFIGSGQPTPTQFSITFEILNYNILANNVNVDLIEKCNELLISNTTDVVQYFDITSLTNFGTFTLDTTVLASTTAANNVFYNRLIATVISTPLANDIQVLQPYQYVKLVLKDQLYKITWKTLAGTLQTKYVAKDCNLKDCLINKLNEILCTEASDCESSCDSLVEYVKLKTASDSIHFFWNRWSQSNIMLDVTQSSNYRLKEYSEWLTFVSEKCSDCVKSKSDCGCH